MHGWVDRGVIKLSVCAVISHDLGFELKLVMLEPLSRNKEICPRPFGQKVGGFSFTDKLCDLDAKVDAGQYAHVYSDH